MAEGVVTLPAMHAQREQQGMGRQGVELRVKGRGWSGQPVLRVAKDKLRYGVVVRAHDQGVLVLTQPRLG
jgi:hypothetical protein